jgi:hypothetical protein
MRHADHCRIVLSDRLLEDREKVPYSVTTFDGGVPLVKPVTEPPVLDQRAHAPAGPFFALIELMESGRGSAAIGGLPGMVALARSIVTPYTPFMRRFVGGRTPCCATTAEPLAGRGLWSSYILLLFQDLLWCRPIPISTGCAPVIRHPLQPLTHATLGAGMQRGMGHRDQVWCRCRRLVRGHRE